MKVAGIFNSSRARFSKFLLNNSDIAIYSLQDLSKKEAKQFFKAMKYIRKNNLRWNVFIIIDSTLQKRTSLHPENSKRFNHGKGFVIGHQWTNIVIIINDRLIPLQPIPFYSKTYCRKNGVPYISENQRVVEYINQLNLTEYLGDHNAEDVLVLADSGYDDQKIQKAIFQKKWKFIIALKNSRTFKTEKIFRGTPESKYWSPVTEIFRINRYISFQTVCISRNKEKKKRMEFRVRQITGFLKNFGKIQLICSEMKKGKRKYLACSDLKASIRQIIRGYRIRWKIELFHKEVKMFMGFEDVSTKRFNSVVSHVHWVYCAYILVKYVIPNEPDKPNEAETLSSKQSAVKKAIIIKGLKSIKQLLTQVNGGNKLKNHINEAIKEERTHQPLIFMTLCEF
jgi:hypothetical protein